MEILKIISLLMSYPTREFQLHQNELVDKLAESRDLPPEMRLQLLRAIGSIFSGDIMDAQENYGLLFDQGRSLSLHLFEHVHGESRDRGQAMVDLMNIYQSNGFELDSRELPDYLPLYLEYLATRPEWEAREWLADVAHIIASVCARLYERAGSKSPAAEHYAVALESLLIIACAHEQLGELREKVAGEIPDNTPEAIDQEWEETAVTFGAPEQCNQQTKPPVGDTQPIRWVDAATDSSSTKPKAEGYAL